MNDGWIQPLDALGIDDEDELKIMCWWQVFSKTYYTLQLKVEGSVVVECRFYKE